MNPSRAEGFFQPLSMQAVPSDDGFHTARGGDTLDAFGPMKHIAKQT